jgi:hypothetical protein
MTLQEFIDKYKGKSKGYPTDSSFKGECLSLAKWYMKELYGFNPPPSGTNSAYGYWSNFPAPLGDYFEKVANTPTGVPKPGDIVIWDTDAGDGFGHIAIFVEGNDKVFTSFDQNWNGREAHLQTHDYRNVVGWLHPKGNMADTIAVDKKDFENLVKKATMLDEILAKYGVADAQGLYSQTAGKDSRITDLGNQLGTALAEVSNKREEVSRYQELLIMEQKKTLDLDSKLKLSLADVDRIAKEKGNLAIELEQARVQIETLKQANQQGEVTITLKEFLYLLFNQKITIKK